MINTTLISLIRLSELIGSKVLLLLMKIGSYIDFLLISLSRIFVRPFYSKQWLRQFFEIGFFSLPVIGLTTLFSGMVLALQGSNRFTSDLDQVTIPNLIVLAITRELAPVLTGLMVAGRIGAAMAAEIASMKVSEQIDALTTLGVDVISYLITPRIYIAILTMPLLVLIGDMIGIFGGFVIASNQLEISSTTFLFYAYQAMELTGVMSGLVKASIFGLIISLVGCYQGYNVEGGAVGIGRATTSAVVYSSILIFIANYIVTVIFFLIE